MSNKHDANVRKITLVNFQIGLIASLLFTFFMFEVYTTSQIVKPNDEGFTMEEPPVEWNTRFKMYEEPKPKQIAVKQPKKVRDPQEFKIVKDDHVIKNINKVFVSKPVDIAPINPGDIEDVPSGDDDPEEVPFIAVEFAPIFPGCEKLETNSERASCFSDKIKRIVAKKFDTGLGVGLGLEGLQRIYVQFDVHKDGTIKNIVARAPHSSLEKEAKRVVESFPRMTPGKQRDKAVTVKYSLPIVFKIQN
ncbi:energy transducer TonB [Aquimarina sp. 2304DJ70-9]|uniref:energy transducer TonB n=1 Tax=Aquimarina penaris TaxID=3231044 RepID=UPI003462BAA0